MIKEVISNGLATPQLDKTKEPKSTTRRVVYFSVQYCTLCAVLIGKCAVLNVKVCSIEI